jgi:Zn finger protein HypA/HybF involved in hydrogenase expression
MRCNACNKLLTDQDTDCLCYECDRVSTKTTTDNNYDGSPITIEDELELLDQLGLEGP